MVFGGMCLSRARRHIARLPNLSPSVAAGWTSTWANLNEHLAEYRWRTTSARARARAIQESKFGFVLPLTYTSYR
jgi:hypothetical protein